MAAPLRSPDPGELVASRPLAVIKAELFRALAHPGRIRILEILRDGDRTVSELIPLVGLAPSHLSHQLAVLRRAHVVTNRRQAANVVYAIADPEIVQLLAVARHFLINSLTARQDLLDELRADGR
jgi:ArsR family transcriptional regulator